MCHVHVEVRIKLSALGCLLPLFLNYLYEKKIIAVQSVSTLQKTMLQCSVVFNLTLCVLCIILQCVNDQ